MAGMKSCVELIAIDIKHVLVLGCKKVTSRIGWLRSGRDGVVVLIIQTVGEKSDPKRTEDLRETSSEVVQCLLESQSSSV